MLNLKSLFNNSNETEREIEIHNLMGSPLNKNTFNNCLNFLAMEKTVNFTLEKGKFMFEMLQKDFSEESFKFTVEKLLKTKTYNNLTIADFYDQKKELPKFYNRAWYLRTIREFPTLSESIDIYEDEDSNSYYRYHDNLEINVPGLKPIFLNGKYTKFAKVATSGIYKQKETQHSGYIDFKKQVEAIKQLTTKETIKEFSEAEKLEIEKLKQFIKNKKG